jgi:hypothetical protein
MRFPRRVRTWVVAALLAVLVPVVAVPAHANYWCDKAVEFDGNCTGCNALCLVSLLFDMAGGW